MNLTGVIALIAGLVLLSATAQMLAGPMRERTLTRNAAVGIRTRYTMASDTAWAHGHAAAAPLTRMAARCGWAWAALALLCCALRWPTVGFAAAGIGYVAVLACVGGATRAANRAAQRQAAT